MPEGASISTTENTDAHIRKTRSKGTGFFFVFDSLPCGASDSDLSVLRKIPNLARQIRSAAQPPVHCLAPRTAPERLCRRETVRVSLRPRKTKPQISNEETRHPFRWRVSCYLPMSTTADFRVPSNPKIGQFMHREALCPRAPPALPTRKSVIEAPRSVMPARAAGVNRGSVCPRRRRGYSSRWSCR